MLNVRLLVNIVLDSSSINYDSWRDLMEQALQHYALIKHITDDSPSNDPGWIRMGSIILNWINNSISADLHQVVREHGCMTCHLWLTIKNQFLGNREQHTLHLDAAFRTFVQGDLLVNEYYRKFKAMADGLADLDAPVEDRILVLNILREPHLLAMKRILRYLHGTPDFNLLLRHSSSFDLVVYTNADWASCLDTCRSTSGYAMFLGDNLVS
jgi:hypothetical protein